MRTAFLAFAVSLVAASGFACGGSADDNNSVVPGEDAEIDGEADSSTDGPLVDSGEGDTVVDTAPVKPTYDLGEEKRKSCLFGPGSKTTDSIGPMVPRGDDLPFKHVIVLMLENRSFDHYFSKLPAVGVTDVDVMKGDETNPDPSSGKPVKVFHETRMCVTDCAHNWGPVHLQYDDGLMDGFVTTSNPAGERAMGYYDQDDIPYYYWLAKTFSISDRYFCSLLGPTWPNRFYFWGGTSWGRTHTPDTPPLGKPKITNLMEEAGKTWKIYRNGNVSFGLTFGSSLAYAGTSFANFDDDVKNDKLADLVLIDPNFSGGAAGAQDDEHPPANVQKGQRFVKSVVDALVANPAVWKKTVLFITYDEHGGFYDHVQPPEACEPDGDRPPDYKFDRYGFRVPLYAISPWTKKGYVSHTVADHTSLTRFIENRFNLGAMTKRDANAWPLLDMFDFSKMTFETFPSGAPPASVDPSGDTWCKMNCTDKGVCSNTRPPE
jgi:phospholipase C